MSDQTLPLVERIARVLAGVELSANAEGDDPHAGGAVDAAWRDHRNQAMAVLHALREPGPMVRSPEDAATWQKIIDDAIANS